MSIEQPLYSGRGTTATSRRSAVAWRFSTAAHLAGGDFVGRIDTAFFDSKSAQWRGEQDRLLRDVATHQGANQTYIEEGVQLLHLAHRAHEL